MKNINRSVCILFLLIVVTQLEAADKWSFDKDIGVGHTYDSNVFKLSPRQISTFENRGLPEATSGRFKDMNSVSDNIIIPNFSLKGSGPGLFRRNFELKLALSYEAYLRNSKKNNFEIALALQQSLWKRGKVKIRGLFIPEIFIKNYLLDAIDDAEGRVLAENRIYEAGTHREIETAVEYEHQLLKRKRTQPIGLTVLVGSQFSDRDFDKYFPGRDRSSLDVHSEIFMDFSGGWELGFGYTHLKATSPVVNVVLILDEPDFGVDFNDNGSILDEDIRVVDSVDRSFRADYFEGWFKAKLAHRADLSIRGARRFKDYSSQEFFDGYMGRRDKRWIFEAEYKQAIAGGFIFRAGYSFDTQKSSFEDVTGDEDDFSRHKAMAALLFRF